MSTDGTDPGPGAGSAPGVIEDRLEEAFGRIVHEGVQRLERGWQALVATGVVAGLEVGIGVLALLIVEERTGSRLLGGLAFSIGFLALLLGHSELFTEGFLIPVTAAASGRARAGQVARFWVVTLLTNLAGGWLMMWLVTTGFPRTVPVAVHLGSAFVRQGIGLHALALSVLAGAAITLMTRMQHGTDSMTARVVAAVGIAWLLAGLPLDHSVLDSLVFFAALHARRAPFGYLAWFEWMGWAVLGNVVGGVGLVTMLRLVRSEKRVRHERQVVAAQPPRRERPSGLLVPGTGEPLPPRPSGER